MRNRIAAKHSSKKEGFTGAGIFWILLIFVVVSGPVFNISSDCWATKAMAADYVEPYEGHGTIDALYDDKIVIGDSLYVLSGLVRYYSDHTMTETAGRYHFKEGTPVGFLVNREGQVEALFLD